MARILSTGLYARTLMTILSLLLVSLYATTYAQSADHFADVVVSYSPGWPTPTYNDRLKALGEPDSEFVSLSNGGSVTLQFDDNDLTGSGDDAPDLKILEVGGVYEWVHVAISKDGEDWIDVGMTDVSPLVDIDAYGYGPDDSFPFVRLTDVLDNWFDPSPSSPGADIDAIEAMSGAIASLGVEIKPETLDLKSKGEFTAFIELPEGYDEEDIDISTVECEGAPALRGTVTGNGRLMVKFDREDLDDLPTGDAVELTVTAKLTDGTVFSGSDTIRVIGPGKGSSAPAKHGKIGPQGRSPTVWGKMKSK